jgi:hypothetical protein
MPGCSRLVAMTGKYACRCRMSRPVEIWTDGEQLDQHAITRRRPSQQPKQVDRSPRFWAIERITVDAVE